MAIDIEIHKRMMIFLLPSPAPPFYTHTAAVAAKRTKVEERETHAFIPLLLPPEFSF